MPGLHALGLISGALWLAACSKPFWKAPPPAPEPVFPVRLMDADIDSISLTQTGCFGPCPIYRYVLRANGTGSYEGYDFTPVLGCYSASLARASFEKLLKLLRRKHFLRLARHYAYPATDQSSKITRVFLADTVKEVDRYGEPADAPGELYEVEAAIEKVGANLPWQYIGPRTQEQSIEQSIGLTSACS